MQKPARVASILLRCLLALSACVATAIILVYVLSEARLKREYPVAVSLARPDAALAGEGRRLARSRGCADCHADDFGGKVLIDQMPFARIVGSNLTQAAKGQARVSNHERMYRALRHGVDVDSRPLPMMPSAEFASLSAREIEALSAYLETVPRVERELPDSALGPIARGMLVAGKLEGFLSAEVIDHRAPTVAVPPPRGTLAYGRHVAQLCTGCHGADFGGGPMSHGGPDAPPAANLTPHPLGLGRWSETDFLTALRTGTRPDGTAIDGRYMPWRAAGQASDEELRSLWRYLRSLPPVARDAGAPRARLH
ncbi:MAG: c-type cytochrome [Luteimonas sp.]|nr:c-type cytochrome [Luteimonas sp.]